jgi:hypothetical protein
MYVLFEEVWNENHHWPSVVLFDHISEKSRVKSIIQTNVASGTLDFIITLLIENIYTYR